MIATPRRLATSFREKIWGAHDLRPWFGEHTQKIGEVWFEDADTAPLLVKFIFTTEKLSVQVHPNDEQAQAAGLPRGKTEMWHVLRAGPAASIALGFTRPLNAEEMHRMSLSGEIEQVLDWRRVQPGDTFFVPAGTVHALGADLTICEIQQNSDVTYRLYDYGRPRPVHLKESEQVAFLGPYQQAAVTPQNGRGWQTLVESEYFETAWQRTSSPSALEPAEGQLLIVLRGEGQIGENAYRAGECWQVEAGTNLVPATTTEFLRTRPVTRK